MGLNTKDITLGSSGASGTFQNPNSDGTLYNMWVSSNTTPVITISTGGTHDLKKTDDGTLRLAPGSSGSSSYTLSVSEGYVVTKLVFTATAQGADMTLSDGSQSEIFTAGGSAHELTMTADGASALTFSVLGYNKNDGSNHLSISKLVVTVEQLCHVTYHLESKQTGDEYTWQDYERYDKALTNKVPNDKQRAFCSYTFYTDKNLSTPASKVTGTETQEVYVNYTVDADALKSTLGWTYSTADAPTWYYLNFNSYNGMTRSKYYLNDSGTALTTSQPISDGYLWAFVGDPYGTRLINKKEGTAKWLVSSTAPTSITTHNQKGTLTFASSDANGHWELCKFTTTDGDKLANDFALRLQGAGVTTFMALANSRLGFYANKDYDSKYLEGGTATFDATASLSATTPVRLTYEVYRSDDDKVASKANVYACPDFPPYLPTELRRGFCQYSYDTDTVTTATTLVKANYLVSGLPMIVSENADHLLYQTLTVGSTGRQMYYQTSSDPTTSISNSSSRSSKNDEDCWAFVGDPYSMKIYNKVTGATKPLGVTDASPSNISAGDLIYSSNSCNATSGPWLTDNSGAHSDWEIFAKEGTKGFCLRLKDNTQLYAALAGYVGLRLFTADSEAALHNDNSDIVRNQPSEGGTTNAGSLTFYVRATVVVNITFKVYDDKGKWLYDARSNQTSGAAPFLDGSAARDFTTVEGYYSDEQFTTKMNTISSATTTVYVRTQQGELPFQVSDPDKDEWHWYYLHIRMASDQQATTQYVTAFGPAPYREVASANPYEPQALWAFVGNVADGFKVYNRWYGKDYVLTNPYEDLYATDASNANHERYKGPVMAKNGTTRWSLIQYQSGNTRLFGLTDTNYPNMSVNVHTSHRDIGFYFWNAKKAINSRMTVEPYLAYSQSSDATLSGRALTQLKEVVSTLAQHKGCVFSLKNGVVIPNVETATAKELEEFVADPSNYVRPEDTPYVRIVQSGADGKRVNIVAKNFVKTASEVRATPQLSTADDADAGLVFKLEYDKTNDRYRLKSQGVWLHGTASAWTTESAEPADELTLNPLGLAQAAFATTATTDYPYLHLMKAGDGTLAIGTGEQTDIGWYLMPATSVEAKAAAITTSGDAYQGKSLATLCYDFPVKANEGKVYYCQSRSGNVDAFTEAPNNEIPAGVPFIYISSTGNTAPTFTILNGDVSGLTADAAFRGILLKTLYNDSDFRYASTLSFGYKSNQAYWLETDGGKKTGVGFRKPASTTQFGPNKGCIYTSSAAAKAALRILFNDATTGISEVRRVATDESYYDLQGRRIAAPAHGIYIHQGKKIVIP